MTPSLAPLSEDEWAQRVEMIEEELRRHVRTDQLYRAANGRWAAARRREQRKLIEAMWARRNPSARDDGIGVITGGMAGAGKGTILDNPQVIDRSEYFTVNPDDVKDAMAEEGMIPVIEGLSPLEASSLVHEESSYLAKRLARFAYRERTNVLWDYTMSNKSGAENRRSELVKAEYTQVDGIFVDVTVDVGRKRAMHRYRIGQEEYRNGIGWGGRYVPKESIERSKPKTQGANTLNYEVFQQVKEDFDSTIEFDNNSDSTPVRGHTTGPRWM